MTSTLPLGRRIAVMLLLMLAAAGLLGVVEAKAPSSASAGPHDAHFYRVGSHPVWMCKNWTTAYGDGRNSRGTCSKTSPKRDLYYHWLTSGCGSTPGFCWDDTDGFYVYGDMDVAVRHTGNANNTWTKYKPYGWWKHAGCNCTKEIKQYWD